MNSSLYLTHEAARLFMQMAIASLHMSEQQLKYLTFLAQMNPAMMLWQQQMRALDDKPYSVTFKNFDTIMSDIPGMGEFARRLPPNATFHFGASAKGGDANKPLKGSTRDHLHIHFSMSDPAQNVRAGRALMEMTWKDYPKPDYKIGSAQIGGQAVPVKIERVLERDFIDLLHFNTGRENAPKVLLPAPMSGHYSTLIRSKIQAYLNAGMDVYVVDINNPRDIPLEKGTMDLNGLAERYLDFIKHIGPGVHIDATCQGITPTTIASAWLAKHEPEFAPASMVWVAGPVDPWASPSEVSELGKKLNAGEVERRIITKVPPWYPGAGRPVNPGFMQISSFASMNLGLHAQSYGNIYNHMVIGADADVLSNREFYEEYLTWCDMEGPYNLQTIDTVFVKNRIARGLHEFRGERVDLSALRSIPLLTMEGEKDDISAPGQTIAAHDLIGTEQGYHFEIPGVGHYGSFHGSKCRTTAMPQAFTFIHMAERMQGRDPGPLLGVDGKPIAPATLAPYKPEMKTAAIAKAEQAWAEKQAKTEKLLPSVEIRFPDFLAA